MDADEVLSEVVSRYDGTTLRHAWGEASVFYNPGSRLPRGVYFATVKQKDGANDRASMLDRPGVFRLSLGTSLMHYERLFGPRPARPAAGETIAGSWDFTALDRLMPHPVYAWMGWVAISNPSPKSFADILPLLDAAYERATETFARRMPRGAL